MVASPCAKECVWPTNTYTHTIAHTITRTLYTHTQTQVKGYFEDHWKSQWNVNAVWEVLYLFVLSAVCFLW